MSTLNLTLLTDLYELTMMQGYFKNHNQDVVVFDAFYRNNPCDGGYSVCAGLAQVIDYIENLHFDADDINYLRSLKIFDEDFLEYLSNFKFSGDIYAVPEGSLIFPREPLVKVVAPIMEAQLIETAILNIVNHQCLIATKAARVCYAAKGDNVMEFGLRRAQGPDSGTYGARAAVIGGCNGTSNVLAGQMFHVPVEKHGVNGHLRQKGKIAELALGYGGAVGALTAMGALEMGLLEEELPPLVHQWREANPHIIRLWAQVENAAMTAVRERTEVALGRLVFQYRSGMLFITLPSGRKLCYVKPRIQTNRFGGDGLTYEGVGESKKWTRIETFGGKLTENIVQATARDLLAEAMLRLRGAGFEIVMHVHDEAVLEVSVEESSVDEVCVLMAEAPAWADGLPLRADGYECDFYKKD